MISPLVSQREANFCIISEQDPKRVLSFAEFLLHLWCRECYALGITYLMKVFSLLSLIRNLTVSNKDEDTTTLISCIAMWLCTLCAYTPYYSSVGSCNRLFVLGFVRTSYQINGSQLHTFFVTNPHTGSWWAKNILLDENYYLSMGRLRNRKDFFDSCRMESA